MTSLEKKDIPISVIRRLTRYYRYLCVLEKSCIDKISSQAFAEHLALTASQVRQDLGYFGGFGHRGYGYEVKMLKEKLEEILGITNLKKCILIGAGNLGTAILSMNYEKLGFDLVGVFDSNPLLKGTINRGHIIISNDELEKFCKYHKPQAAIICTPSSSVEDIAKRLYNLDVKSFLNFSHYDISILLPDAIVESVHLNDSMMILGFLMQ